DDLLVREHPTHRLYEDGPLVLAPEVVDHQEAPAVEVLAQLPGFGLVELPMADLHGIEPGVVEDPVIVEADQPAAGAVVVDDLAVDPRETVDALHQVILGIGIVSSPCPAPPAAPAPTAARTVRRVGVDETGEMELGRGQCVERRHAALRERRTEAEQRGGGPHGGEGETKAKWRSHVSMAPGVEIHPSRSSAVIGSAALL